MIKRILGIFRRRPNAEQVAQDILQEIMQHMARRQTEIEKSQKACADRVLEGFDPSAKVG
jgi:hypothetical protein